MLRQIDRLHGRDQSSGLNQAGPWQRAVDLALRRDFRRLVFVNKTAHTVSTPNGCTDVTSKWRDHAFTRTLAAS